MSLPSEAKKLEDFFIIENGSIRLKYGCELILETKEQAVKRICDEYLIELKNGEFAFGWNGSMLPHTLKLINGILYVRDNKEGDLKKFKEWTRFIFLREDISVIEAIEEHIIKKIL